MSDHELPSGVKVPAKKKVRKRKSKLDNDDEDFMEEIKVQRKPKKIKVVDQKPNSSLLNWLNTSADKSQASTSKSTPENRTQSKDNPVENNETIEVSELKSYSKQNNSSVQLCSPDSKSNPLIVDELISKIDFSSLKSKLKSKLLASPKSQTPNKSAENGVLLSPNKTNKKNTNEERIFNDSKNTLGKKSNTKESKTKGNPKEKDTATKTIQAMFERMKQHKADINGKLIKTGDKCDDSEDDNEFYESFMDSDDEGGVIFLSNKNTRCKVVDSTDNESIDSYANTPVKNGEIMAPPYSPLSPLVRKSLRGSSRSPSASKSPHVNRSPKPKEGKSPGTPKQSKRSPTSSRTKLLQTEKSPLKTPSSVKNNQTESPGQNQITEKSKTSPKTVTKNLFGTKQGIENTDLEKCEDLKEISSEMNETAQCKQGAEKYSNQKRKSKKKEQNEEFEQVEQTANNLNVTSDEDFKTPKKKLKSGKKKSTENKSGKEKAPKEGKAKKKDVSPNINSSLLNYFKKVNKDIDRTMENEADTAVNEEFKNTTNSQEESNTNDSSEKVSKRKKDNVEIETTETASTVIENVTDSKDQSEASFETVKKKKKKKKKHKLMKRSDCVEIRFDFESENEQPENEQLNENDCKNTHDENETSNKNKEESLKSANRKKSSDNEPHKELKTENESKQASNDASVTEDIDMKEEKDAITQENHQVEEDKKIVKPFETKREENIELGKKKKRGRPKKEKPKEELEQSKEVENEIMETTNNETIDESEMEETKSETLETIKGTIEDNKENKKVRQRRERKSKDKKELAEHCDNTTDEGEEERKPEGSGSGSLFKYFKKVDSIPDLAAKEDNGSNVMKVEVQVHTPPCTPSKWKRKSAASTNTTLDQGSSITSTNEQVNGEDTGGGERRKSSRISQKKAKQEEEKEKRRSVEDEIVVMGEEEESVEKKKNGRGKTDDDLFIVKEKKLASIAATTPSKVKLASIFVKKPKMSKQETEARQKFLQSGVPDAIRRQTELLRKQEELIEELAYYTFPVINHVTQLSPEHVSHYKTKTTPDLGPFHLKPHHESSTISLSNDQSVMGQKTDHLHETLTKTMAHSQWTSLMIEEKKSKYCDVENEEWTAPTKVDKALNVLKKRVPTIEQTSVYKQVLTSLNKKSTEDKPLDPSPVLWSDKYRPEHENDILGNRQGVELLRAWLDTQKKAQRRPLCNDESSDEDADFIDDNDSSSQFGNRHNTAILIGPSGCGKTCTVYALANQLGFKVIELNASCNRNGKRILADLSEATQSHQVHHNQQSLAPQANSITAFFTKQTSNVASPGRNLATGFSSLAKHLSNGVTRDVEEIDIVSDEEELSAVKNNGKRKRSNSIDEELKTETSTKKKRGRPCKGDSGKSKTSQENDKNKERNRKSSKRKEKEFIDDASDDEVVSKEKTKKKTGVKRTGKTSLENTPIRNGKAKKTGDNENKSEKGVPDNSTLNGACKMDPSDDTVSATAPLGEDNINKSSMSVILIEDADIILFITDDTVSATTPLGEDNINKSSMSVIFFCFFLQLVSSS
ncbi:hypothetical protein WDU94_006327 [Cyamophila willieti]